MDTQEEFMDLAQVDVSSVKDAHGETGGQQKVPVKDTAKGRKTSAIDSDNGHS
jgi:hypothetical protein